MDGFVIFCFLQLWIAFIKADTCTWENCPKWDHNLINIHIIPHTHDDMGWIKTVDDYYTGANQNLNTNGVQYIINTVLQELNMDPTRKFSYCETGYLTRWMEDHPNLVNNTLLKFVQSGQLEFIGGGWTQPDEAATHYVELVDMYTLGLGILNDRFGRCGRPKTAWQIDPFGHSREHANLVRSMGYNSLFFAREHYLEHAARIANKSFQTQWHTSDDNDNTIFTGAFWGYYCTPNGFDFQGTFQKSEPIVDNPMFEDVNAKARVDEFMQYINQRKGSQLHNHYLVLMGCDFTFSDANIWFTNMDKLITNLNKYYAGQVVAFYSTPTCYTTALNELTSIKWPDKYDDFFPYASNDHQYWTGYFTSKPAMKGLVRKSSALLQLTRQLSALALNTWSDQTKTQIQIFERAVSLSMHHDSITGTSKEAVTQDYEYRLTKGWTNAEQVLNVSMQSISQRLKKNSLVLPAQLICRNINESECLYTKANNHFMVTVHNANGQNLSTVVRFPLYQSASSLSISDANGNPVSYQIIGTFNNPGQINNPNIATSEVAFAANVRPLGFQTYFVTLPGSKEKPLASPERLSRLSRKDSVISNGLIQLTFDSNGYLSQLTDLTTSKSYAIKQEFLYYIGYPSSSGAYVFRPYNGSIGFTGPITLTTVQGALVNEVRQIVNPWVSQVIRLLPNKTYVEFEWTIGPVNVGDGAGKEVITRYTVNGLNTNGVYYTDANGRQLMKRTRNFANSYQYQNTEPIAANYYPINSRVLLTDGTTSMAILTDRSHGGGSLVDGQVEIMLHRRDLFDDGFGVDEALNEPGRDGRGLVVRGKHWLVIGSASSISQRHRSLAYEMLHSPVLTFATYTSDTTYRQNFASEYSGLSQPLPPNVNLLTLKQLDASNVLLRLEHFYQKNEDPTLSQPITVDLSSLFPDFTISQIQTLSLAANNVTGILTGTKVTLNPMDIKAYQLTVTPNNQCITNGNTCSGSGQCCSGLCFNSQCY